MAQKPKAIIHPYWLYWQSLLLTFLRLSQKNSLDCFSPFADGEPFIKWSHCYFCRLWRGYYSFPAMQLYMNNTKHNTKLLASLSYIMDPCLITQLEIATFSLCDSCVLNLVIENGCMPRESCLGEDWKNNSLGLHKPPRIPLTKPSWKRTTSYRPQLLFWEMRSGSWPEFLCLSWNEELWMKRL